MLSHKIIVMRQFYQQAHDHSQSEKAFEAICAEMQHLQDISESEEISLFAYLKNQNGKKLKGHEHQFKYRMNSGDRIFYTYGKFIPNVPDEYVDSIFIYAYSKHDDQDKQNIPQYTHEPEPVTESDNMELDIDEKVYFEDFDFNYISQHSFYVFDEDFMPENLGDSDVYLSSEQSKLVEEYIVKPEPTLILGGAGTGKTVMELHLLHDYKSANPDKKCVYFTQSDALLKKAQDRYNYIISEAGETISENVFFENINDFCRDYLFDKKNVTYTLTDFVDDSTFYNFIESVCSYKKQINKLGINNYDLWSEIRGTIKGGLDENWHRYSDFSMFDFNNEFLQILTKNNLITRSGKNNQYFYINDPESFNSNENLFTSKYIPLFNKITEKLSSVDFNEALLSEKSYMKVSGENSTLQENQRTLIYKIAEEYESWLKNENKYDDNDLVLKALSAGVNEEDKFDYIVIDEIQDYTELQVYTICQFAKNKQCIIMAGDEHQIINPTIFDESRLRKLFYDKKNNTALSVKRLVKNYRCPKEVIQIANKTTNLCMKKIASKGELACEQSRFNTRKPFFIDYDADKFNTLLDSLLQKPNVILLVASEIERQAIIENYGRDKYYSANSQIISTVSEIKGMEYKYVVCFNLINTFAERWKEILSGLAKKQTRYRYYFNLFYVGITRSQHYLCIIEKDRDAFFDFFQSENGLDLEYVDTTDEDILCISSLSNDQSDWLKMAKKEFGAGNYEKARNLLKNVKSEDTKEFELQCDMYIYIQNKDFDNAVKIAVALNDKLIIKRLKKEKKINLKYFELFENLNKPERINKKGTIELLKELYSPEESYLIESYMESLISTLGDFILEKSDQVKLKVNGLK